MLHHKKEGRHISKIMTSDHLKAGCELNGGLICLRVRCGTKHDDTANYCPNCGLAFAKAQTDDKEEQKGASGPDFQENLKHIVDTKDTTGDFDKNDIEQNRVMAILAYLGILVIIPIAAAKNSKFATYHANQGLILLIAEFILSAATSVSSFSAC